ncbi:hypothetical protein [Roseibium sp.]|uniref:hypothetical protein n=1 Tax=Roseibium sp. TaxID=1936156 RepID=UPI003A97B347
MSETIDFSVTSDGWTEVASGSEFVTVATNGRERFAVHVGSAAPALTAPFLEGAPCEPVSLTGLVASDKVYVRAATSPARVVVLRS